MKYEVLTADSYFHIYNCGNNKEDIFIEEKNYPYFLFLIEKHTTLTCNILAYCLLKNHFHLLIKTKENIEAKKISQSFSNVFNAYSKSINKAYKRTGSLFKDRFSRIRIENEIYLKNLIVYIHTNPLHHGFINDFEKYLHSSYRAMISEKETKLMRDDVLQLFEDRDNFIYSHRIKQTNIEATLLLE